LLAHAHPTLVLANERLVIVSAVPLVWFVHVTPPSVEPSAAPEDPAANTTELEAIWTAFNAAVVWENDMLANVNNTARIAGIFFIGTTPFGCGEICKPRRGSFFTA
jgi:hypothetical protein